MRKRVREGEENWISNNEETRRGEKIIEEKRYQKSCLSTHIHVNRGIEKSAEVNGVGKHL